MKKIFLTLALFCFCVSHSQKFIGQNSEFIDFNISELNLSVNENSFNGKFEFIYINYKKYAVVSNNSKILLLDFGASLPTIYDKYFIENIILIKNISDVNILKKIIEKNNTLTNTKIEIEYEGKNDKIKYTKPSGEYKYFWGYKFDSEMLLKKENQKKVESQNKIDIYNKISNLNKIVGVYEITIFKYMGQQLSNTKGKLYVTEEGITLTVDIDIPDNTLRGSHVKDSFFTPKEDGDFYCKALNSLWDEFSCIVNLEKKSGAISSIKGKEIRTTLFSIITKLD